jgi:purine-binding chemotaxis protein CheW
MAEVAHESITASDAPPLAVLLLRLNEELYALPGEAVREIVRYREPLAVPGAPTSIPGLISQRGAVLPVVDLRPLLGLSAAAPTRAARYVVAQHDEVAMALIADEVLDLVELPASALEPLPAALDPTRARLLRATAHYRQQLLALFDLDGVIAALYDEA